MVLLVEKQAGASTGEILRRNEKQETRFSGPGHSRLVEIWTHFLPRCDLSLHMGTVGIQDRVLERFSPWVIGAIERVPLI